jgi:V/A-type H+/Na+-transporting ATPase subunit I
MKARMKKVQLILHHGEKEKFLNLLQEKGILHLEIDEQHVPDNLETLTAKRDKLMKAKSLVLAETEPGARANGSENDPYEISDKIHELVNEIDQNTSALETAEKSIQAYAPWGRFDGDYIDKLQESGIQVRFYTTPKKAFLSFDFAEKPIALISEQHGQVYFVAIEKGDSDLPFEKLHLPARSMAELEHEIDLLKKKNVSATAKLKTYHEDIPSLDKEINLLNDQITYQHASASFKKSEENIIHHIQGWIPGKNQDDIIQFLDANKIAYILSEPRFTDDVPVILKNRKYPGIFESITKIFELPHYRELDLTPVIAVFYPIFFAYCLGDSGYGLIFVLLFGAGYFTFLKNNRVIAALGMILGLFTMVIGILKSGTILGIPITTQRDIPFFDFFSRFVIIPETGDSPFNAFNVALILGLVQINVGVIAAILRAWIYESFEASLSSIGKLFIIICTVVLFLGGSQEMEIFAPYQTIARYGLGAGILLVLFFNNIRLPILERIGSGVLPLYFIFTGLLGDTLSYIRLFALGISSGILGLVINNIGHQIMGSGIIGIIVGVIFLILGHGLNLFISGLGSFVHPLRLTFVEFYNNAGFKGGGIPFKPFKKESLNIQQES